MEPDHASYSEKFLRNNICVCYNVLVVDPYPIHTPVVSQMITSVEMFAEHTPETQVVQDLPVISDAISPSRNKVN